jgi:hypothetical protein
MEIFRAISAEHRVAASDSSATSAGNEAGVYVLTTNAAVADRLLDEEASIYQVLAAKLGHDMRLEVDSAYRYDQFDLVFVPSRAS